MLNFRSRAQIVAAVMMTLATSPVVTCEAGNYFRSPAAVSLNEQDGWAPVAHSEHVDGIQLLRLDPAISRCHVITVSTDYEDSEDSMLPELQSGHSTPEIDGCGSDVLDCARSEWRAIDTLTLFGGLEGSKQPQDFGVNANFGSRWAANWGFPLLADYGIGAQVGTSANYTANAVQVYERVGSSTHRTQYFSTLGVFQRTDTWRWGLVYDALYQESYDQFLLGQWRGRVGYATSVWNEFGVWFTVPQQSANGEFLTIPVRLSPMAQGNAYWQHQFEAGSRVMGWAGVSEGHAEANLLGDFPDTGPQFVFGAEIDVPLNDYFSIFGQANFIGPSDTGTVDSYLGITYFPGGKAFPVTRSPFAPFQALANSTMFALNLDR